MNIDERNVNIPRQKKGWIGHSNVWYAEKKPEFVKMIKEYIFFGKRPILEPEIKRNARNGKPRQLDILKRLEVERIAIKVVTNHYNQLGYFVESFEKDNLGWDLKATNNRTELKLEVKGLSGKDLVADLTPNEYSNLKKHRNFYRICIVTNALIKPKLNIFAYSNDNSKWTDEDGTVLMLQEILSVKIYV